MLEKVRVDCPDCGVRVETLEFLEKSRTGHQGVVSSDLRAMQGNDHRGCKLASSLSIGRQSKGLTRRP
ncbi:TPA: hypothetical protein DCX15_02945 [bacterium]|nr:hypothetical protein [bacterium]